MTGGRAIRWAALALALLLGPACREGDLGFGLSGCDFLPPSDFPRNAETTVPKGFRGGVTQQGVVFLTEHRELLARLLFEVDDDGRVHLEIPDFQFGDANSLALRDVEVTFDLRAVEFEMVPLTDPPRLRVDIREARLAVRSGVVAAQLDLPGLHGDAACYLGNGIGLGTSDEALVHTDFGFDLGLEVDDLGGLRAQVSALDLNLHDFGFTLTEDLALPECDDGEPDNECRYMCGLGEAGGTFLHTIYETIREQITEVLRTALQAMIDALLRQVEGQPLAVVGQLHPRLLAGLLPSLTDAAPFSFLLAPSAEGFRVDSNDIELTLDVGLTAPDHPCVPAVGPPPFFTAEPPPPLSGTGADGHPYHVGFTLTDAVLNRALWVAYRAGALCLTIDDRVLGLLPDLPALDSGLLELALPGLMAITQGPRPFLIAVEPSFAAGDFDLVKFRDVPRAPGDVLPRAGVDLHLPRLGLSFYVLVEERWTRVFAVRTSVDLQAEVAVAGPTTLSFSLAQPTIGALEVLYDEPVAGQHLDSMVELLLSLAQGSLLEEGIGLDLPFAGMIEQVTGLRLEVAIADLSTSGGRALSAGLRLSDPPPGGPQALTAEVDTRAALAGRVETSAELAVEAAAVANPLFQWRFPGGPWSPLVAAPERTLVVEAARLSLDTPQVIEVRAVDAADPTRGPDPTPVRVAIPRPGAAPAPAMRSEGCQQASAGTPSALVLIAPLLALPFARRTRRRHRSTAALVTATALSLLACDPPRGARRQPCEDTTDCPGGLVCLDGFCEPVPGCAASTECCPGAECRQGRCVAAAEQCQADGDCRAPLERCADGLCEHVACGPDDTCAEGARCAGGFCHDQPPCGGRCADGQVCFPDLDVCAPADCPPCPPGQVPLAAEPGSYRGPLCDLGAVECTCAVAPPVRSDDVGRHASMVLRQGVAVFAAWDAAYGDLVLLEDVEHGGHTARYLDGVPPDGLVRGDPTGPRGGITTPGPDRGRYASLDRDVKNRLGIAYYDASAGDLRYLRDDGFGHFGEPFVVDTEGDVGRYARLRTDSRARVHIAFHAPRLPDGQTGLRYALSTTGDPATAADFFVQTVDTLAPALPSTPPAGDEPDGTGISPCLAIGPGDRAHLAWWNSQTRRLTLAVQAATGFARYPVDATLEPALANDPLRRYERFAEHALGRECDLAVRPDGTVLLVFTDADTQALLLYEGPPEGGGLIHLVEAGPAGQRTLLGASPAIALDAAGEPVITWQDQRDNDLRLTRRTAGAFLPSWPVATVGALGFYNSLSLAGEQAVVGTLEMGATATGRAALRLHVFRQDLPRR